MVDTLSPERRSANMRRIRSKNTKPEVALRRLIYRLGYRFRLHRKDLPGKPDLVFSSRRKVIFVHGCFWHQHPGCRDGRVPGTRTDYWEKKFYRNQERDAENLARLQQAGWSVLTVWECSLQNKKSLVRRLHRFLKPAGGLRSGEMTT
jgi:DNA mismatch endonuclease, patch repair protein